jgi:hypothetical protein
MKEKFEQVLMSLGLESDGIGLSIKGLPEGLFQQWLTRPEYRDIWIDNMRKLPYDHPIWAKKLDSFKKSNL